jgi:hypothetical protein
MHEFVELGVKVGSRLVFVRLGWTTASRHGVVEHHRRSAADEPIMPVTAEDHGGCPDHSSEAHV